MNKDDRRRSNLIAKISGIIVGLVLVLGTSYAVFRTTTMGNKDNVVSAGKLDVRVENEKDEITIPNALPQTEEEGKASTPYTFDIVNEGTIDAMYDLYLELEDDSTLSPSLVRYYLTIQEDGKEEKQVTFTSDLLSNAENETKKNKTIYKIDTKYLDISKANKYKLYLWIDNDATTEEASNKTFKAHVRVDSEQIYKENKLIKKVDVSKNGDGSVYAYMYANGIMMIKGEGEIISDLSDSMKVVDSESLLNNYKKVLTNMGYNVSSITTIEKLQTFIEEKSSSDSNFEDNFTIQQGIIVYKETLEEMGYSDTEVIVDEETAESYFVEKGLEDSDGNLTTDGEEFLAKAEEKYNSKYSTEGYTYAPKKIQIDEGITNIPEGLYTGNEDIIAVSIPSSITSIDDKAFYGCKNLMIINIPNSVTNIGASAFYNCTSLTSIDIPDCVISLGNSAFYNCTGLTKLSISSSLTEILTKTFYNCINITDLRIPGPAIIASDAFSSMAKIENLTIAGTGDMYNYNYYSSVPWYSSITKIKNVTISDTLTSIGDYAFYNCTSLTNIKIPNGITTIGRVAFSGCTSLTSVNIPNSVTSIGNNAFSDCTSLMTIEIPNSVTTVGGGTFAYCESLTNINIPSSVTSIGNSAFFRCTSLTSIEIPNSVTSIGNNAFSSCDKLTKLTIDGTKYYGDLGIKTLTDLVITGTGYMKSNYPYDNPWYSSRSSIKNITISDTITSIGDYAFSYCTGITEITIPSSVTSVGKLAFYNCTSLMRINIPDSVTNIENNAFSGWTSSQTINIDNTESYATSNFDSNWKTNCNATINYLRT